MKRQRSKQGRAARLKPQESAPWIKPSALLAGVACAHKSLYTLVFVLLARSCAGKLASVEAFGDFLKKPFMKIQILKGLFRCELFMLQLSVSLSLPSQMTGFPLNSFENKSFDK